MPLYSIIDPPKKGKEDMKKKSERVLINRYLEKELPYDKKKMIDVINAAAKRSGVSPSFLGANALQEGILGAFDPSNIEFTEDERYPIAGFQLYGLDTFSNIAPELKKKKYIPQDFNYKEMPFENEKGERYTSAAFRNNEDALTAMGAMFRDLGDKVLGYSQKKGVNLNQNMQDYLTMSAYNGGLGNAMKMIDELASGKYNQDEFISKGMTSRKGVHKNVAPRIEKRGWIEDTYFKPQKTNPLQNAIKK